LFSNISARVHAFNACVPSIFRRELFPCDVIARRPVRGHSNTTERQACAALRHFPMRLPPLILLLCVLTAVALVSGGEGAPASPSASAPRASDDEGTPRAALRRVAAAVAAKKDAEENIANDSFSAQPPSLKFYGVPIFQMARIVRHLVVEPAAPHNHFQDAQRVYHELYAEMRNSPVLRNMSQYLGGHCAAMRKDFGLGSSTRQLDCRDVFAQLLTDEVVEQLLAETKLNPVQISSAARATMSSFGSWPEWASNKQASAAYAEAVARGHNMMMCVDRSLACVNLTNEKTGFVSSQDFEDLCDEVGAIWDCCACGGGEMYPYRNMCVACVRAFVRACVIAFR
jgi:hypothetical protein